MGKKIDNMTDITSVIGDKCMYCILCRITNEDGGWVKTTFAHEIVNLGCIVVIETRQKNDDKTWTIAETSSFIPGVTIVGSSGGGNKLIEQRSRRL